MLFSSYAPSARRRLALRLLVLSLFSLAAASIFGASGCLSGTCTEGGQECVRGVICVETCGGKVVSSGCCPCAEGTIDTIDCESDGGDDGGDGG